MNEEVFFDTDGSYLESIIRSRCLLHKIQKLDFMDKIDELINLELDLAITGAKKAMSEVIKNSKDNIRPIK